MILNVYGMLVDIPYTFNYNNVVKYYKRCLFMRRAFTLLILVICILSGCSKDTEIVILKEEDICCFFTEGNKVYANTIKDVYLIKKRLYQLEKELGLDFIKINQGCIANLKNVTRFNASFTGTLEVNFKNGYKDYVSRRELKKLKERIGVK